MSLFNIIGSDCQEIIMSYKFDLDQYEIIQRLKYMKVFSYVIQDILLYTTIKKIRDIYILEKSWTYAWSEYLNRRRTI